MKVFYALLGVAGALLLKFALDRRRAERGAPPRRIPADRFPEGASAEDEITGPLAEV